MSVCGTVPGNLTLEALSRHDESSHFASPVGSATLQGSPQLADFPANLNGSPLGPGLPTPGWDFPYASPHRNYQMYWNINQFPIDYAFRPRLRGRLTLGRQTLPRKPSAFGGQGSHLPFRYSCLHSHFRYLQHPSQNTFIGLRNAPLPTVINHYAVASVLCLAPLNCRRMTTRPVSYYALFQGVAASKPTSWLSGQSYFLFHLAQFRDLS